MKILVLNSGSSSQKACLYEIDETPAETAPKPLWEGKIEWRTNSAWISVKNRQGGSLKEELLVSSREQVIRRLLRAARDGETRAIRSEAEIDVVGHCLCTALHISPNQSHSRRKCIQLSKAYRHSRHCTFRRNWKAFVFSSSFWETFRRSRFPTRDFINKCRQRLQSILVLMTGSREAFTGTHSTALIINTAPIVQVN